MANELLSSAYDSVDQAKAARLRQCATWLGYSKTPEGMKLKHANFCRVRLCPVCQWRRSLKIFGQTCKVVRAYEEEQQHAYALLTLTVRNCQGEELKGEIDRLMSAWDKISRRAAWKKVVLGWYRGLEVTHNVNPASPQYDTYHPHFHVLLAFRKSYFTSRYYLPQAEWARLWKEALRVDYDPVVDIRKCKADRSGAIAEVTKYTTKTADYIIPDDWDLTVDAVRILDRALDKRRFVAYGGELAEWHRKLNLGDPEEGDLIHVDEDEQTESTDCTELVYTWYSGYRQYYGGAENG